MVHKVEGPHLIDLKVWLLIMKKGVYLLLLLLLVARVQIHLKLVVLFGTWSCTTVEHLLVRIVCEIKHHGLLWRDVINLISRIHIILEEVEVFRLVWWLILLFTFWHVEPWRNDIVLDWLLLDIDVTQEVLLLLHDVATVCVWSFKCGVGGFNSRAAAFFLRLASFRIV